MKIIWGVCFLLAMIFAVTCQMQSVNSNNVQVENSSSSQDIKHDKENNNQIQDSDHFETWLPTSIEECISKVKLKEPFGIMRLINPYYLRANFDGNNIVDYAILIQGQTTKKRGVIICRDSKETFVFGEIAERKVPVSSFDNDNFITTNWEILTKSETQNIVDNSGKSRIATNAKGESVGFLFEGGGSVFIYWDGKTFQVIEGA